MIVNELASKFRTYPAFTYREAKIYLDGIGENTKNLARTISYLKKNGRIASLGKGVYTYNKDSPVIGFGYSPFYYGLLYAMSIREFWTQDSRPELVTIRPVRRTRLKTPDESVVIFAHHISADRFFGFDFIKYGDFIVPVSDAEKTLIDLFYFRVRLPLQEYGKVLKSVNVTKLRKYISKYDTKTGSAVLKFVKKYKRLADEGKLESPF
jgi:hypothetical protein